MPGASERKHLTTQARKLLAARDFEDVRQGVEILRALGEPALVDDFAVGCSLDGDKIVVDAAAARRHHLRRKEHRTWIALALLRMTGALDDAERMDFGDAELGDLSPLDGLPRLREIALSQPPRTSPDALAALSTLPALESIRMSVAGTLATMPPAPALKRLELLYLWRDPSRAALAALTGLEHLSIAWSDVRDLRALQSLQALRSLTLVQIERADLASLASLPALERLHLEEIIEELDFSPLARSASLRRLALVALDGRGVLGGITRWTGLEELTLSNLWDVVDYAPLATLTGLRALRLSLPDGLEPAVDLSAVEALLTRGALEAVLYDPDYGFYEPNAQRYDGAEAIRGWLAGLGEEGG